MKAKKVYPYKGEEYSIERIATILSRENEISISPITLKKYISIIEYKYYKNGKMNEFNDGIVEEAYNNFLYKRYEGAKVKIYPYKEREYTVANIVRMLEKERIFMSVASLKKYLGMLEDKYKIDGEERRFRKGIVEEACQIYIKNNQTRIHRIMNERE